MSGIVSELLVDTDIFIDHLRGHQRLIAPPAGLAYSVVTRAELFAGAHADESEIDLLLSPFTELPVDRPVAERAGRLRRQTGVRIADALIAATALNHGLKLVTRNLHDFDRVPGLELERL